MSLESWMSGNDPGLWEQAYHNYVSSGEYGIDEWIMLWLWHQTKIPESKTISIFSPNEPLNKSLMGIKIVLKCFHQSRTRFMSMELYKQGDFHPYFEYTHEPDPLNSRFESIGNPIVDTPNYRSWEEYLFYKLLHEILFEHSALDAIIEGVRKHH